MSTVSSPAALPHYIQTLLAERHDHVSAIATIDATLARVTAALGSTASKSAPAPVKPKVAPAAKPVAVKAAAKAPAAKRAKSGLTANEFVLEFIKAKKSVTTKEVKDHWKAAGRPGAADNSLSVLTKAKVLKRSALPGGARGSRYMLA
jgi:hypothetical protein